MSDRFPCVPWTHEKDSVLSFRCPGGQLVKGDTFTTGLKDPCPGGSSESKSTNSQLRDIVLPGIIGDGSNNDRNLVSSTFLGHFTGQSSKGNRWSVNLGHEEPLQDDLVKLGICPPCQVSVQL